MLVRLEVGRVAVIFPERLSITVVHYRSGIRFWGGVCGESAEGVDGSVAHESRALKLGNGAGPDESV